MTGPILFEITAADSHQQIILPVIRLLKKRGIPVMVHSNCEVLRTSSDVDGLTREGIPFLRLAESHLPETHPEWENAALPILRKIPIELERTRPALVVVLNDRNFPSNAYVAAARRLKIPALLVQESLRKDLFQRPPLAKLWARFRRKVRMGIEQGLRNYGQGGCDSIAAWGETSSNYFLRVGVPKDRIVITGNPRFDPLAHADFQAEGQALRGKLGCPPGEFLLTFLSSPIERMLIVSREEKRKALVKLLEWVRSLRADPAWRNLHLAVKLHRGESAPLFREILASSGVTDFAQVAEHPLYPLLASSQAALMFSTTAGLEAALLRVPVGILGFSKPLDDWNFIGRGVAASIRSQPDLLAFLHSTIADKTLGDRAASAAASYLANFGCAAEAVAELAAQIASYPAVDKKP